MRRCNEARFYNKTERSKNLKCWRVTINLTDKTLYIYICIKKEREREIERDAVLMMEALILTTAG